MTEAKKIAEEITRAVRDFVTRSLQSRDVRIVELERRIAEIDEVQKQQRYRGVWQPSESYQRGNLCTHDGSLWVAVSDVPGKPGASGWQLAAKRGADGKSAR